jgi:hypothetical protein
MPITLPNVLDFTFGDHSYFGGKCRLCVNAVNLPPQVVELGLCSKWMWEHITSRI